MSQTAEISSGDRFSFTLFLAATLHAALVFGVVFTVDSGKKVAPTLNITLATHDAKAPPEKADFLAQHNQLASGTETEVAELTTRDVAQLQDLRIRDVSLSPEQKASVLRQSETRIITTVAQSRHQVNKEQKTTQDAENTVQHEGREIDTPLVNPELASLQAKLDQLKQDLAKQPRIRRLTSVSTKASYDAAYLHDWAQKVELIGNKNFPDAALRDGIFGQLRLSVLILPSGTVEKVEILQSSGHGILDEAAVHIVKLSSPFNPFPKEIRKSADKLEIIRTWRFEITGLKTTR